MKRTTRTHSLKTITSVTRPMVELRCRFCGGPSGHWVNVVNPKVHLPSIQACTACWRRILTRRIGGRDDRERAEHIERTG